MSAIDKKTRVPKKILQCINLLASGEAKTQREAAAQAGITDSHLCNYLKKPQAMAVYDAAVTENLRRAKITATGTLIHLANNAASEHVRLDASKHLLALQGIKPDQRAVAVQVNIEAGRVTGYTIDLSEPDPAQNPAQHITDAEIVEPYQELERDERGMASVDATDVHQIEAKPEQIAAPDEPAPEPKPPAKPRKPGSGRPGVPRVKKVHLTPRRLRGEK